MQFTLSIKTLDGSINQVLYQLADNPVAQQWFKKIRHLSRVPLDPYYTDIIDPTVPVEVIQNQIRQDIILLNEKLGEVYAVKESYERDDCNALHAIAVDTLFQYPADVRDIFHRLHRRIHQLERKEITVEAPVIHVGWGEKEGLLTTEFKELPYQYYDSQLTAGNLYLKWHEFGKTPYQYWIDRDLDSTEHFNKTCKVQRTFRAEFVLCYKTYYYQEFEPEFLEWFAQYREPWEERNGVTWTPVTEQGGVLLAVPVTDYDFSNSSTVTSITLVN